MKLAVCGRLGKCGAMTVFRRRPARLATLELLAAGCGKCRGAVTLLAGADEGELRRELRLWSAREGGDAVVLAQLLERFTRAHRRYLERQAIREEARAALAPGAPWYMRLRAERRALQAAHRAARAERKRARRWEGLEARAAGELAAWRARHDREPHTTGIRRVSQWRDR